MQEEFLSNESEAPSIEASLPASTDSAPQKEFVKVMVVGSRDGIDIIVGRLHNLQFAEMHEWSPPTPYGNSGEVMRLVRKRVVL